jgi:flagellar biosynthesis/type III secretory pathway protein FliH
VDVDGVRVELVLDHSLEGLGVVAETASSRVDGRISERLRGVLSALEAEHRRSGAEEDA